MKNQKHWSATSPKSNCQKVMRPGYPLPAFRNYLRTGSKGKASSPYKQCAPQLPGRGGGTPLWGIWSSLLWVCLCACLLPTTRIYLRPAGCRSYHILIYPQNLPQCLAQEFITGQKGRAILRQTTIYGKRSMSQFDAPVICKFLINLTISPLPNSPFDLIMFVILVELVPTVRNWSNNCPMHKSSGYSTSIWSNKPTVITVNVYKEATVIKVQIVQSAINPTFRSEEERHELDMDWMQVNWAVWRTAVGELGRRQGATNFPKPRAEFCVLTHVWEMIDSIHESKSYLMKTTNQNYDFNITTSVFSPRPQMRKSYDDTLVKWRCASEHFRDGEVKLLVT